ncbi:MAG: histone H1 [Nitrosospira sp.]|nr:histone H1 [Nitrosospira sp.]
MTKRTNPRKDFTQVAFAVVQQATGEAEPESELTGKKADSRKGGLKGGKARMEKLTEEQRRELARQAAQARWENAAPPVKESAAKPGSAKQR